MSRCGFFAGSFDPPTYGHLDLIVRALQVVDRLVVGVGINADKEPWLPVEERVDLLQQTVPETVEVVAFDGLAVAAARNVNATLLVRGVRSETDLASESVMARVNEQLDPELHTVILLASPKVSSISSRLVREIHRAGGPVDRFVPPEVVERLTGK